MANRMSTAIIDEMVDLSAEVIRFCQTKDIPRSVINQVTRSVTSIGANFSEAQDASSKKDFLSKIYIAKKEASETKYWLAVIKKLCGESETLGSIEDRTQKFIMMLQKIVNSSKDNNGKSPIDNPSQKVNR